MGKLANSTGGDMSPEDTCGGRGHWLKTSPLGQVSLPLNSASLSY